MKLPEIKPRPRTTAHGARMSDRMARFYNFLEDNDCAVWDWATDETIDRMRPKLQKLEQELMEAWRSTDPRPDVNDVLMDLRNLIKRGTDARVTSQTQAESKGTEQTSGIAELEDFLKGV